MMSGIDAHKDQTTTPQPAAFDERARMTARTPKNRIRTAVAHQLP